MRTLPDRHRPAHRARALRARRPRRVLEPVHRALERRPFRAAPPRGQLPRLAAAPDARADRLRGRQPERGRGGGVAADPGLGERRGAEVQHRQRALGDDGREELVPPRLGARPALRAVRRRLLRVAGGGGQEDQAALVHPPAERAGARVRRAVGALGGRGRRAGAVLHHRHGGGEPVDARDPQRRTQPPPDAADPAGRGRRHVAARRRRRCARPRRALPRRRDGGVPDRHGGEQPRVRRSEGGGAGGDPARADAGPDGAAYTLVWVPRRAGQTGGR